VQVEQIQGIIYSYNSEDKFEYTLCAIQPNLFKNVSMTGKFSILPLLSYSSSAHPYQNDFPDCHWTTSGLVLSLPHGYDDWSGSYSLVTNFLPTATPPSGRHMQLCT
jgi:hypothetical protein